MNITQVIKKIEKVQRAFAKANIEGGYCLDKVYMELKEVYYLTEFKDLFLIWENSRMCNADFIVWALEQFLEKAREIEQLTQPVQKPTGE